MDLRLYEYKSRETTTHEDSVRRLLCVYLQPDTRYRPIRRHLSIVLSNTEFTGKSKGLSQFFQITSIPNIRGVTGGTDQTSGGCSLCYTIPI